MNWTSFTWGVVAATLVSCVIASWLMRKVHDQLVSIEQNLDRHLAAAARITLGNQWTPGVREAEDARGWPGPGMTSMTREQWMAALRDEEKP